MKMRIILSYTLLIITLACSSAISSEIISQQEAIRIASGIATANKYNVDNKDIEILKVKSGLERGPVRLSWIVKRLSSKEEIERILHREFWIVYFYPKGALDGIEGQGVLGGGFCSLVDMHTGKIILFFLDM